jgi:uncharacterized protein
MYVEKNVSQDAVVKKFLDTLYPLKEHIRETYLFGSRCRDDWRPDSDYDILIVLDSKDRDIISRLYDAVIDVLLETGRLISLKIFTISEFNRLKSIPTPFMQNVLNEGMRIGS